MAVSQTLFTLLVLGVCLESIQAAKILVMPWAHYSHVNFFTVAATALAKDGHDVTVLVGHKYKAKVEKAGLKSLVYTYSDEADPHKNVGAGAAGLLTGESSLANMMLDMRRSIIKLCDELFEQKHILDNIEKEKFDLTLNDNGPFMLCLYTIPYRFNIPYISMGVWPHPWLAGIASSPAHEPCQLLSIHGSMNFLQRVANTLLTIVESNMQYSLTVGSDFIAKHAPNKPVTTFKDILKNSQMFIMTSDITCFDFPRTSSPNYRYIGSLSGSIVAKPLPKDFDDIMQSADRGVVIISFGSIATFRAALLPFINKLLDALGRLEQKAIMQFTEKELQKKGINVPENVFVREWLPQNKLLGHPKTQLFVGHGGLNGQLEATYHGIPMLTLPYQPEQRGNGQRAEAKQHGRLLEWATTSSNELYETMKELIENPEYKENVKKCGDILNTLPDAKQELVFWVNHILKFGGDHLKPPSADMDMIEFFMIDIIAFLIGVLFLIFAVLYFCCTFIFRTCCRTTKVKSE